MDEEMVMILVEAVVYGRVGAVQELLQEEPRLVNVTEPEEGNTMLMIAADEGHASIARLLVESGANIGACNEAGRTALHHACMQVRAMVLSGVVIHVLRGRKVINT